jgi:hypothetical protein
VESIQIIFPSIFRPFSSPLVFFFVVAFLAIPTTMFIAAGRRRRRRRSTESVPIASSSSGGYAPDDVEQTTVETDAASALASPYYGDYEYEDYDEDVMIGVNNVVQGRANPLDLLEQFVVRAIDRARDIYDRDVDRRPR